MTPLEHLRELALAHQRITHPSMPDHLRYVNTFNTVTNKESKQLKRIEKFLNLIGGCRGTIIVNTGVMHKTGPDKINFYTGKVTSGKHFTRSGIRNGTADIMAVIHGRAYDIELKRIYKKGRDRQSPAQKEEEQLMKQAGGQYIIVHSFEHFYEWFMNR